MEAVDRVPAGWWRKSGGSRGCRGHWPGHSLGLECAQHGTLFKPVSKLPVKLKLREKASDSPVVKGIVAGWPHLHPGQRWLRQVVRRGSPPPHVFTRTERGLRTLQQASPTHTHTQPCESTWQHMTPHKKARSELVTCGGSRMSGPETWATCCHDRKTSPPR